MDINETWDKTDDPRVMRAPANQVAPTLLEILSRLQDASTKLSGGNSLATSLETRLHGVSAAATGNARNYPLQDGTLAQAYALAEQINDQVENLNTQLAITQKKLG